MEWTADEMRDLKWTEEALGRLHQSLQDRGKWWWMWRIGDVQGELAVVLDEAKKGIYGTPIGDELAGIRMAGPRLGRVGPRNAASQRAQVRRDEQSETQARATYFGGR
jgi:hypothetical protein